MIRIPLNIIVTIQFGSISLFLTVFFHTSCLDSIPVFQCYQVMREVIKKEPAEIERLNVGKIEALYYYGIMF